MRKILVCLFMAIYLLRPINAKAQSQEAQQLLLNVEKLTQLKQILDNMYKGYEILRKGYTAIKDISEGNFSIHKIFLDKLMEVSPVVRKYKRVADIISSQVRIVREYKVAYDRFRRSGNFSDQEIGYMGRVYENLFEASVKKLDELLIIITANQVRMSDDERLTAIDRIYKDVEDQLSFLRYFNNSTALLGLQRGGEQNDVNVMRKIYGVK